MKDNDFWGSILIIFMFLCLLWEYANLREKIETLEQQCAAVVEVKNGSQN